MLTFDLASSSLAARLCCNLIIKGNFLTILFCLKTSFIRSTDCGEIPTEAWNYKVQNKVLLDLISNYVIKPKRCQEMIAKLQGHLM